MTTICTVLAFSVCIVWLHLIRICERDIETTVRRLRTRVRIGSVPNAYGSVTESNYWPCTCKIVELTMKPDSSQRKGSNYSDVLHTDGDLNPIPVCSAGLIALHYMFPSIFCSLKVAIHLVFSKLYWYTHWPSCRLELDYCWPTGIARFGWDSLSRLVRSRGPLL